MARAAKNLFSLLRKIDGKGYKAYKQIEGEYIFPGYRLYVDHVQADPFAAPSRVRVSVEKDVAKIPQEILQNRVRQIAFEDYLTRFFAACIKRIVKPKKGSGKSGIVSIVKCSQQVLERTSMRASGEGVEVRFFVGLPAAGRKILGKEAEIIFGREIPQIVEKSLIFDNLPSREVFRHIYTVEDAQYIRDHLKEKGLVAFVGNGSHLPRQSGVDERPLTGSRVVPFNSPPSLEVTFNLPNSGMMKGMGIPAGVTLIVGGGYHGKSTLLNALSLGCYNHIPGDGREWVVAVEDAVKIRAEDGRFVCKVDISPFINNLPFGEDTGSFSTANASGSTSQAANIMEALEVGASLLLIDEDTSATNFMIRDERMQELVKKEKEPITPLIDKIKLLYRDFGVSTILVMGGSGDYFDVADTVIMLDSYKVFDVTGKAKAISEKHRLLRKFEGGESFGQVKERYPLKESFSPYRGKKLNIKAKDKKTLIFGKEVIDLARVEQLVEEAQVRSIGDIIYYMAKNLFSQNMSLKEALKVVGRKIKNGELESLLRYRSGDYAAPRVFEIAAAINRLSSLNCR